MVRGGGLGAGLRQHRRPRGRPRACDANASAVRAGGRVCRTGGRDPSALGPSALHDRIHALALACGAGAARADVDRDGGPSVCPRRMPADEVFPERLPTDGAGCARARRVRRECCGWIARRGLACALPGGWRPSRAGAGRWPGRPPVLAWRWVCRPVGARNGLPDDEAGSGRDGRLPRVWSVAPDRPRVSARISGGCGSGGAEGRRKGRAPRGRSFPAG